jgi:hypothetical protein
MKLPRVRFTIGRMMVAVAISAIFMAGLLQFARRKQLIEQYEGRVINAKRLVSRARLTAKLSHGCPTFRTLIRVRIFTLLISTVPASLLVASSNSICCTSFGHRSTCFCAKVGNGRQLLRPAGIAPDLTIHVPDQPAADLLLLIPKMSPDIILELRLRRPSCKRVLGAIGHHEMGDPHCVLERGCTECMVTVGERGM